MSNNTGFDPATIAEYRAKMQARGLAYLTVPEDDTSDEYAHVQFIGTYEGREVIYDAVLYTLRLQHESELFELAEHKAAQHFPQYKKITYQEDENGNMEPLDTLEEEIGLFMAEVMVELEEEGEVKVKEHVDIDVNAEFGIGLDVGLKVEAITQAVIEKFIREFNDDALVLDEALYSFQTHEPQAG